MARSRPLQSPLFAFLSVLACTIGALAFLLVTLALSQVTEESPPAAVEPRVAPGASGSGPPAIAPLDWAGLELAEARLEALDAELVRAGLEPGRSLVGVEGQLEASRERQTRAERHARAASALAALEQQAARLDETLVALEQARRGLPVWIDPSGLSPRRTPYFVECEAAGLTARRAKDEVSFFVPDARIEPSGDFGRYLRRIRAVPRALLVVLVRESGVSCARRVVALAEAAEIRVARLPIPGDGPVDFRLLRESRSESG